MSEISFNVPVPETLTQENNSKETINETDVQKQPQEENIPKESY